MYFTIFQEDERLVTITGNDMQQFRAQYLIYQRIAEQQGCFLDEVFFIVGSLLKLFRLNFVQKL